MKVFKYASFLFLALFFLACQSKTVQKVSQKTEDMPKPEATEMGLNNLITQEEIAEGWQLLFDGRSADHWKGYTKETFPDKGWKVENGMLTVIEKGTGGDIITKEKYENFDFKMEFQLTEGANSGLLYGVVEQPGTPIWHSAPEYQLIDDFNYISKYGVEDTKTHLTADNYDMESAMGKTLKPIGEWNEARLVINNGRVQHWLNGKKVLEYDLWSPQWEAMVAKSKFAKYKEYGRAKRGHIGIQDHGNTVNFRNIKIKKLKPISLFNGNDLEGWEIYGTEKWYVDNGNLICESGPDKAYGYLGTTQKFKDFDLTLEFQQEADGNSGVFFRSSIEGTKITGWQAEVAPPMHNSGGIYESYGRGWLIKPDPEKGKALKMGEWNTMRIRAVGDDVTTWINGEKMVSFKDKKIGKAMGQIALQIHDGGGIKVRWRNIRITPL